MALAMEALAMEAIGMEEQNAKGQVLFVSQTADDFKRWFVWDTLPDRPGLVLRFDVITYLGKPVCSVEDISVSHDPRFASPPFEIPKDRWLRITATVASDNPHHFFTLAFEFQQREGNRVVASVPLPFTVFASDRWRTANLLVPPASIVAPKANYTYAQLIVRPVLYGQYFGQCHAWHIKTGRVHLARIQVEALPANFEPTRDDKSRWFEFATQLLPKDVQPIASFDFLTERPAGKKGFVRLHPNGYLIFEDGTPVRLWGVAWHENYFLAQEGKPKELRDEEHLRAAKTLSALGVNFVRWHGLGRGLWDEKKGELHQQRWQEVVDPLLALLTEHGIYHQFTLWFFSHLLMPREKLPPEIRDDEDWWRAYPSYEDYHRQKWAIFCFQPMLQQMLDIQEQIMAHLNPHRNLRYADDPAIVIVQPINEVSLMQRSPVETPLLWNPQGQDVRQQRVLPVGVYRAFTAEWNEWLRQRFGSREKMLAEFPELAKEWEAMGIADADPAKGNVPLPPTRSLMRAKTGREDGWWHRVYLEFAMERERRFYNEFAQRMRKLGYRNAVAGDAGGEWRQYLVSQADLDVGYDIHHPYTDYGDAREDFQFALNNPFPLQSAELIYECQAVHMWGKAAVISERGAGTVNEWRAMLPILVAVDSAMQQRSAIAEHTFGYPFMRPDHFLGVSAGFGNLLGDPARIATYPVAATLFCIPEAIQSPKLTACQLFTDEDLATPVQGLQGSENAGQFFGVSYLVHVARVRWARWDGQSGNVPNADLLYFPITSGVGNLKALPADKKLFIVVPPEVTYSGWQIVKPYERVLSLYHNLRFRRGRFRLQVKLPNGYEGMRDCEGRFLELASLPENAVPIGVDEQRQVCWAFYDKRSLVVADPSVLQDFIPAALDTALKAWGLLQRDRGLVNRWELVSSTGQVRRNWKDGWITVDSDYGQVIMGDLSKAPATRFLAVKGKPQFGVVALVPLERKPVNEASRWFLVAVGRIANKDYDAVYNEPMGVYRLSGVRLKIGQGPPVCEPLQATATLRKLGIKKARVVALTPQLTKKQEIRATILGGSVSIPLANTQSLWLVVERKE
jgi:hypothetical protein